MKSLTKEQILYVLKENESLQLKIKRLEQSADRLQTRFYDSENELNNYKRKYDFLKGQFKEVARQCFPRDFIENNVGGGNEKEVFEFLLESIRSQEQNAFNNSQEAKRLLAELNEISEEIERLRNAGPIYSYEPNTNIETPDTNQETEHNTPKKTKDETKEIGKNGLIIDKPKEIPNESNPVLGVLSLITDKDWPIIECIGSGKTLFSDIATIVKTGNAIVSNLLDELIAKGILTFEKVVKGGKGRPAHHYFLTPLGQKIYEMKFENKPITTMLEKLSTHGSPSHGGLMLEVGTFLQENNCEVYYDGPETSFKLRKSGREIRFDIKAIDKETKDILLFETERGKCGSVHLQEKIDKCFEFTDLIITKVIHIIAPDKTSLHNIQQELFRYVRKNEILMLQGNNKDKAIIIFKTATLDEFKNGKFQEFYYGQRDSRGR